MTPTPESLPAPKGQGKPDYPNPVYVEFSDLDHPWEPIPPDELRELLKKFPPLPPIPPKD